MDPILATTVEGEESTQQEPGPMPPAQPEPETAASCPPVPPSLLPSPPEEDKAAPPPSLPQAPSDGDGTLSSSSSTTVSAPPSTAPPVPSSQPSAGAAAPTEASGGAAAGQGGAAQPQRRTCIACRRSKVKCDRKYPCSRCERLELVCLQQPVQKGRATMLNTRKRPFEQLYDQSTGYMISEPRSDRKVVVEPDGRPAASQPQLAAEIFIAKFAKIWASGQMSREKTISVLRSWAFWNMLHGSDCSLGALSIISKILDFEHVGHILCSAGGSINGARGSTVPDEEAHFGSDRGLEERAAVCQVLLKFGELGVQCNERFEQGFMATDECKRALRHGMLRPEYLLARFISRDSYKEFYESLCALHFQCSDRVGEIIHVLQCVDRFGSEVRCLVRCRLAVSESGDYFSVSLLILPLPGPSSSVRGPGLAGELPTPQDAFAGLGGMAQMGGFGGGNMYGLGGGGNSGVPAWAQAGLSSNFQRPPQMSAALGLLSVPQAGAGRPLSMQPGAQQPQGQLGDGFRPNQHQGFGAEGNNGPIGEDGLGRLSFDALGPLMGGARAGSMAEALASASGGNGLRELPAGVRDILSAMKSGDVGPGSVQQHAKAASGAGGDSTGSNGPQEETAFLSFVQACRRRGEDGSVTI